MAFDHPRPYPSHPQSVYHDGPSNLDDDPQLQTAHVEEKKPQSHARKDDENEG